MSDPTGGPYLKAALLCEKVLRESDGVHTLVRVIDRFVTHIPSGQNVDTMPVSFFLVLMFTSGFANQKMKIKSEIRSPSGQTITAVTNDVFFQGGDQGCNIIGEVKMDLIEEGLYWIEVSVNGQLQTKVPLRWLKQQTTVGGGTPS